MLGWYGRGTNFPRGIIGGIDLKNMTMDLSTCYVRQRNDLVCAKIFDLFSHRSFYVSLY